MIVLRLMILYHQRRKCRFGIGTSAIMSECVCMAHCVQRSCSGESQWHKHERKEGGKLEAKVAAAAAAFKVPLCALDATTVVRNSCAVIE